MVCSIFAMGFAQTRVGFLAGYWVVGNTCIMVGGRTDQQILVVPIKLD